MKCTYLHEQWGVDVKGVEFNTRIHLTQYGGTHVQWDLFVGYTGGKLTSDVAPDWETAEKNARAEAIRRSPVGPPPTYTRAIKQGTWRMDPPESGGPTKYEVSEVNTDAGRYALWSVDRATPLPEGVVHQHIEGKAANWDVAFKLCESVDSRLFNAIG